MRRQVIGDAFKVLKGEGVGGNPKAQVPVKQRSGRRSIDRGCWQLNSFYYAHVPDHRAYNEVESARVAHEIYLAHGWKRWCSANKVGLGASC